MRAERYEVEIINQPRAARIKSPGVPRGQGRTQAYAGLVECGQHPTMNVPPSMIYSAPKKGWDCLYEQRKGGKICQSIGDNDRLVRVLDVFCKTRLTNVLRQHNTAFVDLVQERNQAKALTAHLQAELRQLQDQLRDKEEDWEVRRTRKRSKGEEAEEIRRAYERFYADKIEPLEDAIKFKERQMQDSQ